MILSESPVLENSTPGLMSGGEETWLRLRLRHRHRAKAAGNSYSLGPTAGRASPRLYNAQAPSRKAPGRPRKFPFDEYGLEATPQQIAEALFGKPRPLTGDEHAPDRHSTPLTRAAPQSTSAAAAMSVPATPKRRCGRPLEYPFDKHGLDATPDQIARAILRGGRQQGNKPRAQPK